MSLEVGSRVIIDSDRHLGYKGFTGTVIKVQELFAVNPNNQNKSYYPYPGWELYYIKIDNSGYTLVCHISEIKPITSEENVPINEIKLLPDTNQTFALPENLSNKVNPIQSILIKFGFKDNNH